jgi:hypothetical protein
VNRGENIEEFLTDFKSCLAVFSRNFYCLQVSFPVSCQQAPQMKSYPAAMLVAAGFACSLHCILPCLGSRLDYVLLPNSAVVKLGRVIATILVILGKLRSNNIRGTPAR